MATRKLKNCGRRQALFGSDSAAILAAAGINVAGTLAASAIGASATKKAAQDQANATIRSATKQAQAIKDQSAKAKEAQTESQEFIKEQNAENRELQKDIQLQLQMLTGAQNVNDRLEASKMQVKNGGSTKRKLRRAGKSTSLLQGSNNMPFIVTDGGGVQFIGSTPEGFDLYEIKGNDHEHYHKAQGGKNKTGVGIKFADGNVVEGEGNQNTNQGEYLLNTPDNAYFISRHSIAGVNPAKMVNGGMHPLKAYAIQERLKAMNGISDDGKHNSTPVKKMMGGFGDDLVNMYNNNGPQPGVDTSGDVAVGVAYDMQNQEENPLDKRSLKCGGRKRLDNGGPGRGGRTNYYGMNTTSTSSSSKPSWFSRTWSNIGGAAKSVGRWTGNAIKNVGNFLTKNAELTSAGIGALGNIGGAWITAAANRSAANMVADAQNRAAGIMADAYRSLTGIDMNSIRREDYAAAHAMPALQAPVSFAQQGISKIDRGLQRTLANAGKYSASGASAQERMARAEVDAQDMRNQVYSADQQQMQQIRQANAERVSKAAELNAQLDTQANKEYASAYLDALQYNNDINNQKILGAAGALAEGAVGSANTMSAAQTSNAQAWANALLGGTQGFTNSLTSMMDRKAKIASALLGAGSDSQASYYANVASASEAKQEYDALIKQYNAATDEDTKKRLARQINNIASKRGFDLV